MLRPRLLFLILQLLHLFFGKLESPFSCLLQCFFAKKKPAYGRHWISWHVRIVLCTDIQFFLNKVSGVTCYLSQPQFLPLQTTPLCTVRCCCSQQKIKQSAWRFLTMPEPKFTNISQLFSKESFCNWSIWLLTLVNWSNKKVFMNTKKVSKRHNRKVAEE